MGRLFTPERRYCVVYFVLDAIPQAIERDRIVRGGELGTSEIAVKIQRGQVMCKMEAASLAVWSEWLRSLAGIAEDH